MCKFKAGDLVALNLLPESMVTVEQLSANKKYGLVILTSTDAYNSFITSSLVRNSSRKLGKARDPESFLVLWSTGTKQWHSQEELWLLNAAR